jgi:uncharacterized protein involved in type VI secretion and phage assembly
MNDRLSAIGQSAIATVDSPVLFLHCAIFAANNLILDDETFRLASFQGQESVSEPFEYQLELHGNTDARKGTPLQFEDVIGRPVTVGIEYPKAVDADDSLDDAAQAQREEDDNVDTFQLALLGADTGDRLALFNGIVTAFSMEIPGVYRLTMKPALWKLSLTNGYEIHHQLCVRDAIAELLDRHAISYSMDAVSGDDNLAVARVQDWLQAGETDLEFLRRLMGKAHLYYYFTHTGDRHTMVFVNRPSYTYPAVFDDGRPLRYAYTGMDEPGLAQSDVISQYRFERSLTPSGVRGVFTRQEAAWEADPVSQFQSYTAYSAASQSKVADLPFNQYKIYQYGCSKDEVSHFTDSTGQALETSGNQFSGSSFCAHFRVGHQFNITAANSDIDNGESPDDGVPVQVQPSLEGRNFVLTQVKHDANADGGYRNEFQATEAGGFITAFSIQETQQGSVLGKVVAKAGSVPPQDWRYYTANYFDPETETITDASGVETTLKAIGVYVRFSTDDENSDPVWVKLAPHMQTVPEIGVTVVVARAQDESELPEIQSIIQANGSMVIMPSTWTANTHVGSSYSTNYGDSQSIRFGKTSKADLTHAVGIVGTAYETAKYRDTGYSQGASYNFSCAEADATKTSNTAELFGPYSGATDMLSASESFGSSYNRQYAQVTSSFSDIGTSYSKSKIGVSKNYSTITGISYSETTHGGDITSITTINADSSSTTNQTGNSTTTNTNTGTVDSTTTVTGAMTNTSTYGGKMTSTTTHNASVESTTDHYGGVDSTTTHHDNVTQHNTVQGISTNFNTNNIVLNFSTTIAQTSSSATVASNSNDAIAASNKNTAVGVSLDINAIGSSTNVNMIGNNNTVELIGPGFTFSERAAQPKVEIIDIRLTMIEILQIYL